MCQNQIECKDSNLKLFFNVNNIERIFAKQDIFPDNKSTIDIMKAFVPLYNENGIYVGNLVSSSNIFSIIQPNLYDIVVNSTIFFENLNGTISYQLSEKSPNKIIKQTPGIKLFGTVVNSNKVLNISTGSVVIVNYFDNNGNASISFSS